jgi:hypothetical protein
VARAGCSFLFEIHGHRHRRRHALSTFAKVAASSPFSSAAIGRRHNIGRKSPRHWAHPTTSAFRKSACGPYAREHGTILPKKISNGKAPRRIGAPARERRLQSRHSATEASFVDAEAKLQHHPLEADLDANEKVREKLEAAVATWASTSDNFAKAIAARKAKIDEAGAKIAAERASIERNTAAGKLARDLDESGASPRRGRLLRRALCGRDRFCVGSQVAVAALCSLAGSGGGRARGL